MKKAPTRIGRYDVHPLAATLPWASDEELEKLKNSIEKLGQQKSVLLDKNGRIVCGRKRAWCCEQLAREPRVESIPKGMDGDHFVADELGRRHMSTNQIAMSAVRAHESEEAMRCLRVDTVQELANLYGISRATYYNAEKVVRSGSKELLEMVSKNEVGLRAAASMADLPKAMQKKICKEGADAVISYAKSRQEQTEEEPDEPVPDDSSNNNTSAESDSVDRVEPEAEFGEVGSDASPEVNAEASTSEPTSSTLPSPDADTMSDLPVPYSDSKSEPSNIPPITWSKPGEEPVPRLLLAEIKTAERMDITLHLPDGSRRRLNVILEHTPERSLQRSTI
jgi:hypothetical protein